MNPEKRLTHILIIGAGPTGLSAALELAHAGLKPELVEKRAGPSEFSRAVGIIPVTRYNLRHAGVGDAILKESVPWRKFAFYRGNKTLLDLDLSGEVQPEECILGLPQDRTESLIRDALAGLGVETKYNTEAIKLETTDDLATVTFADGRVESYNWVIACDGKHSAMREQLGIAYDGHDLEETWSIADIDMSEDFDCERCRFWIQGEHGHIATCLPIEKRRARALASTPDALKAIPVDLGVTNVRRAGTFKISVRQAETYRKGRVLLAGDSAHCHSPVGGSGMNLGIDDAIAAAQAIINETTEFYSDERRPVGAKVLKLTEAARKKVSSESLADKMAFSVAMTAMQHVSALHGPLIRKLTAL